MSYLLYDDDDEFEKEDKKTDWGLKGHSSLDLFIYLKSIIKNSDINPEPSRKKDAEIAKRGKPIKVTVKK